jgi:hypothetical protein
VDILKSIAKPMENLENGYGKMNGAGGDNPAFFMLFS